MPINIKSGALRVKNKDGNYVDINSFIRGGSVTKESIYEALGGKPVTIEKQLVMTGDLETGLFVLDRIYQEVKNSIDFEDYVFGSIVIPLSNALQDDLQLGQICYIASVDYGLLCLTLSNACFN